MLYQWLNFIGLLFDFFGAVILVVPDFRWLATKFTFGRLREARDAIDRGGLMTDDIGFDELNRMVSSREPAVPVGEYYRDEPGEYKLFIVDRLGGGGATGPTLDIIVEKSDVHLQAWYEEDADVSDMDFFDVVPVYQEVRKQIEPTISRFRFVGLTLLAFGFGLQAIAAFLTLQF